MEPRPTHGYLVVPTRLTRNPGIRRALALLRRKGYTVALVPLASSGENISLIHDHIQAVPTCTGRKEAES
jgi:hypothetical protein